MAMVFIPLTDTTEARYGEIARKMIETGDWITPQFQYGIPFWAKPPLSFWLSSLSMKVFGINTFSARLPSLLLCIGILALVWCWVSVKRGRDQALLTTTLLSSTVLFYSAAGAVMTDASLAFCTTLIMVAFWNAIHGESRLWGYLVFAGLGLGLLAKGPIVGVLALMPIVTWVALRGDWMRVLRAVPWVTGTVLMLMIAMPWYLLAEHKTPGFLNYFLVGEHLSRFLHSGWTGDKYGHAHAEPVGTIWLFWIYSAFPFSVIAVGWLFRHLRTLRDIVADADGWRLYLLLWSVALLVFFTFAGNVIWPYVLPALPAFAILTMDFWQRDAIRSFGTTRFIVTCGMTASAGVVMMLLYLTGTTGMVKASQHDLVDTWLKTGNDVDSQLVYFRRQYQSAMFYSEGKIKTMQTEAELKALLANKSHDFIAISRRDEGKLSDALKSHFATVKTFGDTVLLSEKPTDFVALGNIKR
jgi:4-amino-4-deoxy-L-arabinose transferase-like glycosyltransferase